MRTGRDWALSRGTCATCGSSRTRASGHSTGSGIYIPAGPQTRSSSHWRLACRCACGGRGASASSRSGVLTGSIGIDRSDSDRRRGVWRERLHLPARPQRSPRGRRALFAPWLHVPVRPTTSAPTKHPSAARRGRRPHRRQRHRPGLPAGRARLRADQARALPGAEDRRSGPSEPQRNTSGRARSACIAADFAWPERMVLAEVQGGIWAANPGRHNRGSGYERDCERDNSRRFSASETAALTAHLAAWPSTTPPRLEASADDTPTLTGGSCR
jgi:hypothetical protein